jgi:hypothetical protein
MALIQQLPSTGAPASPLSSRAKPRDPRFSRSLVEMFFHRSGEICGSLGVQRGVRDSPLAGQLYWKVAGSVCFYCG